MSQIVVSCFCGTSLTNSDRDKIIWWLNEHLDEYHPQAEQSTPNLTV